jgi:hypothetical protein
VVVQVTKSKKKDSLVWLEELVEAAKAWRSSLDPDDVENAKKLNDAHGRNLCALAVAVDGYQKAIKDEVEAELDQEEKGPN